MTRVSVYWRTWPYLPEVQGGSGRAAPPEERLAEAACGCVKPGAPRPVSRGFPWAADSGFCGGSPLRRRRVSPGGLDGSLGTKRRRAVRVPTTSPPAVLHRAFALLAGQGLPDPRREPARVPSGRPRAVCGSPARPPARCRWHAIALAVSPPACRTPPRRPAPGSGSNVTPMRTQGARAVTGPRTSAAAVRCSGRSRGSGCSATPRSRPTTMFAPLLPGLPAPPAPIRGSRAAREPTTPVTAGAAAMSPLIRPLEAVPPLALSSWSTVPEVRPPGLFAAPRPRPGPVPLPGGIPRRLPPVRLPDRTLRADPRTRLNPVAPEPLEPTICGQLAGERMNEGKPHEGEVVESSPLVRGRDRRRLRTGTPSPGPHHRATVVTRPDGSGGTGRGDFELERPAPIRVADEGTTNSTGR